MHWLFLWDISVNLPENLSPAPAGAEYILPDFLLAIQEKRYSIFLRGNRAPERIGLPFRQRRDRDFAARLCR